MLSEEITELSSQLEECAKREEADDAAIYHLQKAQATVNERYAKLEKANIELHKSLDETMKPVTGSGFWCHLVCSTHNVRSTCF